MPGRKLTDQDLASFKAVLLRARSVVAGDISSLEADAFGTAEDVEGSEASPEGGSDSYAQEFSLELMEIDEDTLRQIDAALERLESGGFGQCQSCDAWLLKGRLRAMPHAENCIECQRAKEQGR